MTRSVVLAAVLLFGCSEGTKELRRGNVLFNNGALDEAEVAYQAALSAPESKAEALEGLGSIAFERKKYAAAEAFLKDAVAASPKLVAARHKWAVALARQDKISEAIEVLQDGLRQHADDPYAHFALGGLFLRTKEMKRAEESFLAALRLSEDYHPARFALGNLLIDDGRTRAGEQMMIRLAQADAPDAKVLAAYGLARLDARAGRWPEAARRLEDVLVAGPAYPERILDDAAFSAGWSTAPMAKLRRRLLGQSEAAGDAPVEPSSAGAVAERGPGPEGQAAPGARSPVEKDAPSPGSVDGAPE